MTRHGPSQVGSSCPLRSRSPLGARSHPSIPPCSVLSASLRSALRLSFGLPSLPPFGARLRFGGLSSPNWGQIALQVTQGQYGFAKSRGCPHLSAVHPQLAPPPSPALPHADADTVPVRLTGHRGVAATVGAGRARDAMASVWLLLDLGRPGPRPWPTSTSDRRAPTWALQGRRRRAERSLTPNYKGVTYAPEIPPSTRKVDAVMNEESSLAKNAAAAAISDASPKRPIGMWTRRRAARSGSLAKSS